MRDIEEIHMKKNQEKIEDYSLSKKDHFSHTKKKAFLKKEKSE